MSDIPKVKKPRSEKQIQASKNLVESNRVRRLAKKEADAKSVVIEVVKKSRNKKVAEPVPEPDPEPEPVPKPIKPKRKYTKKPKPVPEPEPESEYDSDDEYQFEEEEPFEEYIYNEPVPEPEVVPYNSGSVRVPRRFRV